MSNPPKRMPFWFKLLSGLSFFALLAVMGGILFTESWVGVVADQLNELNEGDIDQAYYLYTSKDFQTLTPLENFRAFAMANPILLQKPSAHFINRSLHQNISTLKGDLIDFKRHKIPIEYQLIKEDGKWKILSIHLMDTSLESRDNKATL